nr:ankyrin repeat domain-containing protein [Treponemataceae bacterium]
VFNFTSCLSLPKKNNSDRIQKMIKEGKIEEAKKLFQSRIDINEMDSEGNTALHTAALINDTELINFLIYKGANAELKNYSGDTPLHIALKNDNREAALILSSVKSNIFTRDGNNRTALAVALDKGEKYYDIVINEKTADIRDLENKNLVHYIIEMEDEKALSYCIKNKIPLSYQDNYGQTPLSIAYSKNSDKGIKLASMLLMASCTPERREFSYFEDCMKIRNVNMRFDDGQTPLHFSAIYGHEAVAKFLIKNGASINAKDILGSTPLHEAVRYGQKDIVEILLKNKANPNSQDSLGKTPLLLIAPAGERQKIYSCLLENGADPNTKDMYGDSPLHLASMTGMDKEILELLVSNGADINERNKKGIIPMALAVDQMFTEHVRFYALKGADIHAEDNSGNSPLSRVLENKSATSLAMLKIMVNGQNINSRDSYGNTALHIAIQKDSSLDQIKYLLSLSNDIDARNRNGDTPLYIAVQKNRRQAGEMLLSKGANVFSTNNSNYSPLRIALASGGETLEWVLTPDVIKKTDGTGNTPLHYACEWKLDSAVSTLLGKGANSNAKNSNGESPLFSAIKSDSTSTVELLLRNKAKINERDYLGNSALHACIRYDAKNSAMKLIQWKIDMNSKNLAGKTALAQAARSGRIAMVTLLLENKSDINAVDSTGKTVLIDAIQSNNEEIVAMLLKRGASVQVQEMYGRNAYHEAVLTGNISIIKMVERAGGNPLSRDAQGITPFSLALKMNPELIKAVLGSDRKLMDSDSNTPVHIAIQNGAGKETIDMLIKLGYPVDTRNNSGMTALSYAVEKNMTEQVRSLLENNADPFIQTGEGNSPLSLAFSKNKEILDSFVEIVGNEVDYQGEGILHYAAKIADIDTVKRLITKGLDRNIRNVSGERPADVAKRWKRSEIANILQ